MQHLHSITQPTLKNPGYSTFRNTTTYLPTHAGIIVCTRVNLKELNMDMVFGVGGRSRQ